MTTTLNITASTFGSIPCEPVLYKQVLHIRGRHSLVSHWTR